MCLIWKLKFDFTIDHHFTSLTKCTKMYKNSCFYLWSFNFDKPLAYYEIRIPFKLTYRWNCHVTSAPIGVRVHREERGAGTFPY